MLVTSSGQNQYANMRWSHEPPLDQWKRRVYQLVQAHPNGIPLGAFARQRELRWPGINMKDLQPCRKYEEHEEVVTRLGDKGTLLGDKGWAYQGWSDGQMVRCVQIDAWEQGSRGAV